MTGPESEDGWQPSPELLAAYFDGECEGRDDFAGLRRRLERWLADNPRGRAELAEYRHLRQLWLQSTPAEPAPQAWQAMGSRIEAAQGIPRAAKRDPRHRAWRAAALIAAAACVLVAIGLYRPAPAPLADDDTPFPVASANEVVIMRVEGDDTNTLVVGELPLDGPMVLAAPGEITVTSAQPAQRDKMIPNMDLNGPGPPIIWAGSAAQED